MPRAVPSRRSSERDDAGPDGGDPHTPAARVEAAVGCVTQSLEELADTGAAEVIFVRHARDRDPIDFVDALAERSVDHGFAVAKLKVGGECAFDSLTGVVEAAVRALRVTGLGRKGGLVAMLDAFAARDGTDARTTLARQLAPSDLAGELGQLALGYLGAKSAATAERARIDAWLSGVELSRAGAENLPIHALSVRTAKRALGDLTRVVRALGHRGMLLLLHGAETIASLPPARRQAAYTVLRELVDNADGGRGMVGAALVVVGSASLFTGPRSITSLEPLAHRLGDISSLPPPSPRPHQPLLDLAAAPSSARKRVPTPPNDEAQSALRAIIRASHGLPPIERVASTSVGHQEIERAIDTLFAHSRADGSVFALLTGGYGAGKTHFLLHLAARALAEQRPVFRLSLERLDLDLGHPERHLRRLLDGATLPGGKPQEHGSSPIERLAQWTASDSAVRELVAALSTIAADDSEAADAAKRALQIARRSLSPASTLAAHLGAADLAVRAGSVSSRRDAYGRLLLWLELLERREATVGPVLLIDEAENLYRGGVTEAERRTALRSLSFYCGGALPRACVVLAITPDALVSLQAEAPLLLDEVSKQKSVLAWEDATMLCRRLERARPLHVPAFGRAECAELASRLAALHREARGARSQPDWSAFVASVWAPGLTPRQATLRLVDRLERSFWSRS